jgi:hypothetical protein
MGGSVAVAARLPITLAMRLLTNTGARPRILPECVSYVIRNFLWRM